MSRADALGAILTVAALAFTSTAQAGGVIAGATEPTQIMNNLQLVKVALDGAQTASTVVNQYATQIQQYQAQLTNLMKLPQLPEGLGPDAMKAANDLGRYKAALESLMGSLGEQQADIERRLAEARLGGMDWNTYMTRVAADAASKGQRAVERLKYEESLLEQVQSDYQFARNLQSQIPATVGQHQALQLLNAQMNRVVTQNAKLLEVMSSAFSEQTRNDAKQAGAATEALAQEELLRQRQSAIQQRQRAFGGWPQ